MKKKLHEILDPVVDSSVKVAYHATKEFPESKKGFWIIIPAIVIAVGLI